jgi:hypothetical protein
MGRKPFQPLQLGDAKLDRLQANLAGYLATLDGDLAALEAPVVQLVTKDHVVKTELVIDYRGSGGHSIVLPPADGAGTGRSRLVYVMNNGGGTITVLAPGKNSIGGLASKAVAASTFATAAANGDQTWSVVVPGARTRASWFSPVTSALLLGATSILGDFSVGPAMRAIADMTCRGIRFYWKQPAGAPTSRNVKVSLWRQFDGHLMQQTTITVPVTGEYFFEFPATTLAAYQNYIPSIWDTHPTSGTRVFTHSGDQEKGAGYPQGQRLDGGELVQAATLFGPYWLYVVGGFHAGDVMPDLSNKNRYPTELMLDDVEL